MDRSKNSPNIHKYKKNEKKTIELNILFRTFVLITIHL